MKPASQVTLTSGDNLVRLVPDAGGGIAEFLNSGRQVLRSASRDAIEARDPLGLACFPMTPFVNRIRNGRFTFRGRHVTIVQRGVKHPLHGQGWRMPWRLASREDSSATLEFDGGGDDWPWRYRSSQRFELSPTGLCVELAVENRSKAAMPASLGLHPYFPDRCGASLKARSSGMWETDSELMPTGWVGPNDMPTFQVFSPLGGSDLDNCLTGFDGTAMIRWSDRPDLSIRSQGCNFLQIYTRGVDESFCIEPQTAMPDALNAIDPGGGAAIVEPGQTFSCLTCFDVSANA